MDAAARDLAVQICDCAAPYHAWRLSACSCERACGAAISPVANGAVAGHERPKGHVRVESVRLPTADISRRGPLGRIRAKSGLTHCSKKCFLFDQLVGA